MIENLQDIGKLGIRKFVINEKKGGIVQNADFQFVFIVDVVLIAEIKNFLYNVYTLKGLR